jgi:3',5'-cyclic AMP phosphodiesterase CpdA
VFVTGDIVDNAQENELDQAIATLNGKTVHPDSGAKGYDGVQDANSADPFYYRPDHDAPEHPGALGAAQRPFKAAGLRAPWYPLPGNHDLLAQGEVPPTTAIQTYATGNHLVAALDPRIQVPQDEADAKQAVASVLSGYIPLPSQRVPSDPHRRLLTPAETEQRLIKAAAKGTAATPDGLMDYAVDVGPLRAITLDTVRRDGTSQGLITPAQVEWLKQQLATDRWVIVLSHNPLDASAGGDAALAALDANPHVVAAISGNRHKNVVTRHNRFWLIGTSSLADFPQQARMFRLRATPTGVALETWMVDHDGKGPAGISRELAYLDAQGGRPQRFAGKPTDRNVRLFIG